MATLKDKGHGRDGARLSIGRVGSMLDICVNCPLYQHYNGLDCYVPPTENVDARYMLVGEAPGGSEVDQGEPFVGASGREQNQYLNLAGLSRSLFHIRNLVQCRPPGNRDPKPEEVSLCQGFLMQYIQEHRPRIIGAVGRFAARWFLGESMSMEYCHGIPQQIGDGPIIVPIYHPAAGMKSTSLMTLIRQDYEALGKTIRGEIKPRQWPPTITEVHALDFPHFSAEAPDVIAVDTETNPDGSPWCLTYCQEDRQSLSRIIMADDHDNLAKFNAQVNRPGVVTVLHNALFDLGVLARMGIYPAIVHDTMVMAYLLQDLPLGLKPLAYRLLNITMRKYTEVVHEQQQVKTLEYLLTAASMEWPDPEQVLVWEKGYPRVKQPQNILKKINKIFNKLGKDPELDISKSWKTIDADGGRSQVEAVLGPLPQASLRDVEFGEALQYACTDAVATYGVYKILRERITAMDLWNTFNRDMKMMPVVAEMMDNGILIDKTHLHNLDQEYEKKRQKVDDEINSLYDNEAWLNPGSPTQVAQALYDLGVFPTRNHSTDSKSFDLVRDKHPIVNLITRWRGLGKLQSTYLKPLPKRADSQGRIHTKFSNTNTVTGRLSSSKPNLQNIPVRTAEGMQIRHAFIASPGCKLLSCDYSQIEMRCTAHMAEDQTMIRMFLDNLDIHSETAARMFGVPIDQVDKNLHRRPAKSIGFGVVYCMGALGLQDQLRANGIEKSERECMDLIAAWYGVYPDIYNYMDRVKAEARRTGLVRDFFGRYRLVPEVVSTMPRIVNAGLRQASNFPIQSMAQQIIKQAMGDLRPVYKELTEGNRWVCKPLLQIHDELVFEVSEEIAEMAGSVISQVMEDAVELVVPTPTDCNIGNTWGELK